MKSTLNEPQDIYAEATAGLLPQNKQFTAAQYKLARKRAILETIIDTYTEALTSYTDGNSTVVTDFDLILIHRPEMIDALMEAEL